MIDASCPRWLYAIRRVPIAVLIVAVLASLGSGACAPALSQSAPRTLQPGGLHWAPDVVTDTSWSVRARRDTVVHLFLMAERSRRPDSARAVIRGDSALAIWWEYARGMPRRGDGKAGPPPPPSPTIDFRTGMVLAVTTSRRGGSGDWIRIDSVSQAGDTLLVHVNTPLERRGCGSSPAYQRSVDLVLVPRVGRPIRFVEHRTPVGSCSEMDLALRTAHGFDLTQWALGPGQRVRRPAREQASTATTHADGLASAWPSMRRSDDRGRISAVARGMAPPAVVAGMLRVFEGMSPRPIATAVVKGTATTTRPEDRPNLPPCASGSMPRLSASALRSIRACVMAGLVAAGSSSRSFAQPAPIGPSCEFGAWTPPRVLPQRGRVPETIALAAGAASPFLVSTAASPSLASKSTPVTTDLGQIVVTTMGGHALPALPTGDQPVAVKAVVDRQGGLHVLWAEERSGAGAAAITGPTALGLPRSLWTARYAHGRWTRPRLLYTADWIAWDDVTASPPVVDAADAIHVALGVDRGPGRGPAIAHLTLRGERVDVQELPIYGATHYVSLAAGRHNELYLAFIGPDSSVRGSPASVLLQQSPSGGRQWTQARPLFQMIGRPPSEIRVAASSNGTVAVVWGQTFRGGAWPDGVRAMLTRDGGRSWSRPLDLELGVVVDRLRAEVDACGQVHAIVRNQPSTGPDQLVYASLTAAWSRPDIIERGFGGVADLSMGATGRVWLTWTAARAGHGVVLAQSRPVTPPGSGAPTR